MSEDAKDDLDRYYDELDKLDGWRPAVGKWDEYTQQVQDEINEVIPRGTQIKGLSRFMTHCWPPYCTRGDVVHTDWPGLVIDGEVTREG